MLFGLLALVFAAKVYAQVNGTYNPSRGFYNHPDFLFLSSPETFKSNLTQVNITREYGYSVEQLVFYMDNRIDGSPLSDADIELMSNAMELIRDLGMKALLRFGYTNNQTAAITEPEPSKVFNHIRQLYPFLKKYESIISTIQPGFVGVYGEGFYSKFPLSFILNHSHTLW